MFVDLVIRQKNRIRTCGVVDSFCRGNGGWRPRHPPAAGKGTRAIMHASAAAAGFLDTTSLAYECRRTANGDPVQDETAS